MRKGTEVAVRKSTAVADWKAEAAAKAAKINAAAQQSLGNWMSIRGGTLTFKGQEVNTPLETLILDAMLENAYYAEAFDPDNPVAPTCFALGYEDEEMAPHDNSIEKQAETCSLCDWNKFGTGGVSGRGKACKNQMRVALLSAADITRDGIEQADIARLRIPVTSVAGLKTHLNGITARVGKGVLPAQVVSQMTVQPDPKTQVKVDFAFPNPKNIVVLPDKVMPSVMGRVKEAEKQLEEPYAQVAEDAPAAVKPRGKKTAPPAVRRAAKPAAKSAAKPAAAKPKTAKQQKQEEMDLGEAPKQERRSKF